MGFKSSTEISKVHRILGGIVRSRFATHHVGHQICVLQCLYLYLYLSLSLSLALHLVEQDWLLQCLVPIYLVYSVSTKCRETWVFVLCANCPDQPSTHKWHSTRISHRRSHVSWCSHRWEFRWPAHLPLNGPPSLLHLQAQCIPCLRRSHSELIFTFSRTIFGPAICPSKCSSSIYSKSHQSPSEEAVAANRQQLERYSKGGHNIVEKLIYHVRQTKYNYWL